MNWAAPAAVLSGVLAAGEPCGGAPPLDVLRLAGWRRLAGEPFRLERLTPEPARALAAAPCLGRDGETRFYGAVVFAGPAARRVVLRCGAGGGAIDLLSDVALGRCLAVGPGARLHVVVHAPGPWRQLPPWGYHHMCG